MSDAFRTYVRNRAACCALCNPPGLVEHEQLCVVLEREGPPALALALCHRCLGVLASTSQHRRRSAVVDPRRDVVGVMMSLAALPPVAAAPVEHCGCGAALERVSALAPLLRRAVDAFADGLGSEGEEAAAAFGVLAYEVLQARGLAEYCAECAGRRAEQAHLELVERLAAGSDLPSMVVRDSED